MSRYKSGFDEYIKAVNKALELAMQDVGQVGVELFQEDPNIKDRIFTGRLSDSMSWATAKKSSGVGSNAVASDQVPKPDDELTVNIGTACPYAITHQEGYGNKSFSYGSDGNPGSREELVEKLRVWCASRGIDESAAETIATKLENNEIHNYPFFYAVVAEAKQRLPEAFADSFKAHMPNISHTDKI